MATDFSISRLLDLPSEESKKSSEPKEETELPVSGRFFPPIHQLQSSGKYASHSKEASHPRETPKSPIDLRTRFSASDFATIVIPKTHAKPRRKRTAFSNIQLHFLEQFFQKKAYPSSQERNFIASILNIGSGQVKTWYQNRRTKMKKNKVFGFGIQEPTVSSALDPNVNCFDLENQPRTSLASGSSHTRSHMFQMQCPQQPTLVGSNLVLLKQQGYVTRQACLK